MCGVCKSKNSTICIILFATQKRVKLLWRQAKGTIYLNFRDFSRTFQRSKAQTACRKFYCRQFNLRNEWIEF